jgi:hypothetical protein
MKLKHEQDMEDLAKGNYHIEPNSKVCRFAEPNTNSMPLYVGKEILRNKVAEKAFAEASKVTMRQTANILKSKLKK